MDILHLIDRLEELVAEAKRMPLGAGVVIDRRRLLELIDQMRASVPWEVQEAREIVNQREAVLEEARREGEGIIHRAEMDAQRLLDQTELMQAAQAQADLVIQRAEERAQQVLDDAQQQVRAKLQQAEQAANNQMDEADRYALEMLKRLDQQLNAFTATVRAGIESLEARPQEDVEAPAYGP